jgi:SsrA-binding protein
MSAKQDDGRRIVSENRKARHEYFITDSYEAGIELKGTEVKSLRTGQANIAESYASFEDDGSFCLVNAYIPVFQDAGRFFQHEPRRKRRLLLHKSELAKLLNAVDRKGMTIVPLELYFNSRGRAKLRAARQARDGRQAGLEPAEGAHHARQGLMAADASSLAGVDWSTLPIPEDDGGARHLSGARVADVVLPSTAGGTVSLARVQGRTVLFIYPMTGTPGVALPDGWDEIPGARGCTPHTCAFRDLHAELRNAGASAVFGLSTQTLDQQRATADRLHLPFPLLSDAALAFGQAMGLPQMTVAGTAMLKRMALVLDRGTVTHVFYPVFPPDRNAADALAWIKAHPASPAGPA